MIKISVILLVVSLFACSKNKTTPKNSKNDNENEQESTKVVKEKPKKIDNMTIEGDLGTIDRDLVNKKFEEAKNTIDECIYKGVGQSSWIGGNMNFMFRIDLNGRVKKLGFSSNTGSRLVDKCVYNFAKGLTFIKPKGGEAKVSYSYGFAETMEIKEDKKWGEDEVTSSIKRVKSKMNSCSDGTDSAPGSYDLVFYVLPDGVLGAASITTGKELVSDKFYKCVIKKMKKAKFRDPLGTVAKVNLKFAP
jgi:hypothetical protein